MTTCIKVTGAEFAARMASGADDPAIVDLEVVDAETGHTMGYFIGERDYDLLRAARAHKAKTLFAWELDATMVDALKAPLVARRPDLDAVLDD